MPTLADDIGRLNRAHGTKNVKAFFNRAHANNAAIPGHGWKRSYYNYLKSKWNAAGIIISESFLRSDVILAGSTNYTFSLNESDGTTVNGTAVLPTTQRINQNDVFEAVEWTCVIWTQDTTNNPPYSTRRLYTYPNPFIFSGAAVAGVTEADALMALYSGGRLALEIGTTKIIPRFDMLNFYRVPTSQEGQVTAAIAGPTLYRIQRDGFPDAPYPFQQQVPFITLNGNGKNTLQLVLPETVNMTPATYSRTNSANYISLFLRGFLVSNGAKQQNRASI